MFQSTRPRGARRSSQSCRYASACFNPRAHVGRDGETVTLDDKWGVSIHAPTWGATQDKLKEGLYSQKFQSTRPRGARRSPLLQGRYICASFNPRAHVGRDLECGVGLERLNVSIHAPTWGATQDILSPFISCPVSIHAPTWGATFIHWWLSVHLIVSIHAPTWGAT